MRALLAAYEQKRDLIALGAYAKGSDARVDRALLLLPDIERYLQQSAQLSEPFEAAVRGLSKLSERAD